MEEKRRLPSWMVGTSTTKKLTKPLDADASSVITSDEVTVVTKSPKPKAKAVTRNRKKEVCLSSDKNVLVKCETKRKKRRLVEEDVVEGHDPDHEVDVEKRKRGRAKRKAEEPEPSRKKSEKSYEFDSGDHEVDVEKRKRGRAKRKADEPEPSRKKSEKSYEFDSGSETQSLSFDEEDDDLTMDDVLSIAKEFVENEKRDTGQQKPSEVQSELRSKSPYARSPMHEETDSHHEPVETGKVTLADYKITGDPAQDMLDLFLGDLLKKPIAKDETRATNDIIIPHEIRNKQHAPVVSNKPVTLTKKKSSLKDAVAMLLD